MDDIKAGNVTKVNLEREWALGQFCHSNLRRVNVANLKVAPRSRTTFTTGDTIYGSK